MTTSLWQLLWDTTHWVYHVCKHWHGSIFSRLFSWPKKPSTALFSEQAPKKCTTQTWPRTTPWLLPPFRRIIPAHTTAIPFLVCLFHFFSYTKLCSASEKNFFSRCIQTDKSQNTSKLQIKTGSFSSLFFRNRFSKPWITDIGLTPKTKTLENWEIDSTKGQTPSKTDLSKTLCATSPTSITTEENALPSSPLHKFSKILIAFYLQHFLTAEGRKG